MSRSTQSCTSFFPKSLSTLKARRRQDIYRVVDICVYPLSFNIHRCTCTCFNNIIIISQVVYSDGDKTRGDSSVRVGPRVHSNGRLHEDTTQTPSLQRDQATPGWPAGHLSTAHLLFTGMGVEFPHLSAKRVGVSKHIFNTYSEHTISHANGFRVTRDTSY
jgi:hypothetical protein